MSDRIAVQTALEALGSGDAEELTASLLGCLEDGPPERGYPCPHCAIRFEWPGLRDAHILAAHGQKAAA